MTIVRLQTVESSQINAIGYDPETQTLAIQFKNWKGEIGSTYHYSNVTQADFDAFNASESKGKHFGRHIKPHAGKFPYTKVADKPDTTQEVA